MRKIKAVSFLALSTLLFASQLASAAIRNTQELIKQSLQDMVFIKGDTYTMGPTKPSWQAGNDTPPHKVTLSSFYFSRYNVSYGKYDAYTQAVGKPLIQKQYFLKYLHKWIFFRNANHPVNNIT